MAVWSSEDLNWSGEDWNRLGVRRALQGEWDTARDCFEQAVARRGDVVMFWINLGFASLRLGDEDTGRGALEVAEILLGPLRPPHRPRSCIAVVPIHGKGVVNE